MNKIFLVRIISSIGLFIKHVASIQIPSSFDRRDVLNKSEKYCTEIRLDLYNSKISKVETDKNSVIFFSVIIIRGCSPLNFSN